MRDIIDRRVVTPPQLACQYGVSREKIIAWIESGELRAINLATRPTDRPRWAINLDDLADFENRRAAVPPAPKAQRRSRRPAGKQYF